jgi:bacillithiol biosynthesis cysteine-adding enzyme BshC
MRDVPGPSRLFLDFLSHSPQTRPFYPTSTLSINELSQTQRTEIPADRRQRIAGVLARQNQQWKASPQTLGNIERLRNGAQAIVTGQQVGLFLGPAYTIYKAVTVIRLARELTSRGVDAVPVFWLASEDHDLAEVNHIFIPDGNGGLRRLETASNAGEGAPVGRVVLRDDVTALAEEIRGLVGDSEILELIRSAYIPGKSFTTAFAELMTKLFSTHGLILLEPSDPEVHEIGAPLLRFAAEKAELLTAALLSRNKELESAGYHAQVKVTNSSTLLFFLKDGKRTPVHRKNTHFSINGEHWTVDEFYNRIAKHPELFTANVLLRPVLQDYLLPTAVYVAGPAETAYFAQVQVVSEHLLGRTTPVWPRFSATLVEPRLASWMRRYGLHLRDVLKPKDDFLATLAKRTIPADLKEDFDRSREQLDRLVAPLLRSLKKLDPTVAAAGEVSARKMRYQLKRLESRSARAHLQREQTMERHATLLTSMLFPERELQERHIAGVYFLGDFGTDLVDRLIIDYRPECPDHQVLSLS